jgi:putative FmdB family regulatory protein
MPIYIYRCANCDYEFEHNQRFSDPHLQKCPQCGKLTLNKVFTPATVIYKGSGFYSTDHRSSSGSSASGAHKKKDENSAEKKSETPAETAKSPTTSPASTSTTPTSSTSKE